MKNTIPIRKTYIYQEVPFDIYEKYQKAAWTFSTPEAGSDYFYFALLEEKGEALGVVAKAIRANIPVDIDKLTKELGDVMWQIAAIATSTERRLRPSHMYSGTFEPGYIDRLAHAYKSNMTSSKRIGFALDFVRCMAAMFKLDMIDIMTKNIEKLEERKAAGTIDSVNRKDDK